MSFASPATLVTPRTWTRGNSEFFISNDPSLISVKAVNDALSKDFLYWAKPLPEDVLGQMLRGSMSFGVYQRIQAPHSAIQQDTPNQENTVQIGLARMITDGISFAYLSDTYVLPEYQGNGLGKWLIECVAEVFSTKNMPYLRRIMLLTGDQRLQEFYRKIFGVKVIGHEERPDIGQDLVFMCARPNAIS
ncbi:hypothetical protein N7492_008748 [Penicillium capsulatum]|uniref:N-acetyltransferase domain-containing protein n=1 Tax=Penicillium capsulatum TaxID=69766 RepID=A0A9W9HTC2_9EURO|nr:hypothetical protein N7492_008748 [Penicillium capsulatum]KAJ6106152.1 hypothetical protein N7512_009669 [Penicillium capsulatum]